MENNKNQQEVVTVQHSHTFKASSKEIRRLGYDLGYGVTTGIFSAMFMVHLCLGVMKAIKHHAEKKLDVKVETGEPEESTNEETAEE